MHGAGSTGTVGRLWGKLRRSGGGHSASMGAASKRDAGPVIQSLRAFRRAGKGAEGRGKREEGRRRRADGQRAAGRGKSEAGRVKREP